MDVRRPGAAGAVVPETKENGSIPSFALAAPPHKIKPLKE